MKNKDKQFRKCKTKDCVCLLPSDGIDEYCESCQRERSKKKLEY